MTLEEALALGNQGDLDAIIALGNYYLSDPSNSSCGIFEALKWFKKGVELENNYCMQQAARLGRLEGRVLRKEGAGAEAREPLKDALRWAEKALDAGFRREETEKLIDEIRGELGIAYYFAGLNAKDPEDQIPLFEESIHLLKWVYTKVDDLEVSLYLAFAIRQLREIRWVTELDELLAASLLMKCVNDHFDELEHTDVAAFYLGMCLIEGYGGTIDHDLAYHYFQKAHNAGFDCSDILCQFKKTLFGGYKLKC